MNETNDTLIILITKFILFFGFIYSLKYWFNKSNSFIPVVIYWLFGLFFVLVIGYTLIDYLVVNAVNTRDYSPISAILAIIMYVYIGMKKFKKT